MKSKLFFITLLICSSTLSFSQMRSFSKLVKRANVETSSGNQHRIISTTQGLYRIFFEGSKDSRFKPVFTLLSPGQNNGPGLPRFALLEERGYIEIEGQLLKKCLYSDTGDDAIVQVLIADDYSLVVIFKKDDTILEYIK